VKVQKAEINEIYNFVYSTNWPPVNIFIKSVRCWKLLFGLAPKWSKSMAWFVTRLKYLKIVCSTEDFHRRVSYALFASAILSIE